MMLEYLKRAVLKLGRGIGLMFGSLLSLLYLFELLTFAIFLYYHQPVKDWTKRSCGDTIE